MATVRLVDVGKNYGKHEILKQVNLEVQEGEFLAVIGPSGCGKSTLLRLIAGLDELSTGKIYLDEQCINKLPPAKRNMAMVFQNYALYPHMTAYDNMAYGLKLRGYKQNEINKRVLEAAELLQIGEYLQRKPQALSGGQRQRVAMGRAIVRNPSVFLFDEPLSNLDAKLRNEMRHEIRKIHQQLGTTCIYVTHDQTEAMTMANRVAVLKKGKIEQLGTPKTLYQQPNSLFVAGFTGHYPINLIPAKLDAKQKKIISNLGFHLPMPEIENSDSEDEEPEVVIGIRPEHLKLTTQTQQGLMKLKLAFIDDMGADKLVHTTSLCGELQLTIRIPAEEEITSDVLAVDINLNKASLFNKKSGLRMGGWQNAAVDSIKGN